MPRNPPTNPYAVLGLPEPADVDDVKAAFRRLAKENHPDLNPGPERQKHFIDAVHAYRALMEKLRHRPGAREWGRCRKCGRDQILLPDLSGGTSCADCLLGVTLYRRFLPMPVIVVMKHLATWGLYAAGIALLIVFLRTHDYRYSTASLLCVTVGLLVLGVQVIRCR